MWILQSKMFLTVQETWDLQEEMCSSHVQKLVMTSIFLCFKSQNLVMKSSKSKCWVEWKKIWLYCSHPLKKKKQKKVVIPIPKKMVWSSVQVKDGLHSKISSKWRVELMLLDPQRWLRNGFQRWRIHGSSSRMRRRVSSSVKWKSSSEDMQCWFQSK